MSSIVCTPRTLTPVQAELALRRAQEINPDAGRERRLIVRTPPGRRGGPRRIVVDVDKKWPSSGVDLSVQFLDNASSELRKRILLHMNAWSPSANVRFRETHGVGQVRIARLDTPREMSGYWSYIGTEILAIDEDQPTMNLEGFTMRTSEAEFRRVVRHEAGHTLGFEHEHMRVELVNRIDRRKAFAYYDRTEGWTEQETMEQVLTPLAQASIMGTTEADPLSIMCYQIPAEITKNHQPIEGGVDINPRDFAFAATLYPKRKKRDETESADAPDAAAAAEPPPLRTATAPLEADTFHLVIMDRFRHDDAGRAVSADEAEYVRVFASYGGARVTVPLRTRAAAGEAPTGFHDIIRMHERIKKYTNRDRGSLPAPEDLLAFGGQLFETLFQGDVRRLYDEARARQRGRRLDFVLTSMVPWIAEKPWEFAYDRSRRSFLATEEIHFVRNVLTSVPADEVAPRPGPLRMLVVSAQPIGFGRLSIEQETEVIRRGFQPLIDAGLATVQVRARITPWALHAELLNGDYTVVHFIGHAQFNEQTQEGELIFEDERGGPIRVGERSAREIFCRRGIRLVFLNACQTAAGSRSDFNTGVAQSLVAHGLPALVANQYSVLDASATQFSRHFYWLLAQGRSIGEAAREARIGVNYLIDGEVIDWAVPVVYARDPCMSLCPPSAAPQAASTRLLQTVGRRRAARRPYEVAVWDIDNAFPELAATLAAMTQQQQQFGFQLADLSAPVDTWYLEERAPDGSPYLWVDKLAERLGHMAAELGVNLLACVTRHWLCDDVDKNIYGWWPNPDGPRVVVFSFAGFERLAPVGLETDRLIANVMGMALAGVLTDMDTHTRGPHSCPMWRNVERNYDHLIGRQAFDPDCRRKLRTLTAAQRRALDALISTFFTQE